MSQVSLSADILQISDRVAVIDLNGMLIATAESAVLDAFEFTRKNGSRLVILDFSGVSGIDSFGVSLLVKLHIQAKHHQMHLAAAGLKSEHRDVFKLTGIEEAMTVYETRSQALSANGVSSEGQGTPGSKRFGGVAEASDEVKRGGIQQWAKPVLKLHVPKMPGAVSSLNVEGRRPVGPIRGFGQMWEKTYELRFSGSKATPAEIADIVKKKFVDFQPPQNHFYPSPKGIKPGETVLIGSAVLAVPIYTGVLVSYADDVSFTLMTPQGHPESGWVAFRAFEESSDTVCQIQSLARASDPVYEIAFRLHGAKVQEGIWIYVMESLAKHLGVNRPVKMSKKCVDAGLQWAQVGNTRHNAQLWTLAYLMLWPFRRLSRLFRR